MEQTVSFETELRRSERGAGIFRSSGALRSINGLGFYNFFAPLELESDLVIRTRAMTNSAHSPLTTYCAASGFHVSAHRILVKLA